MTDSLADRLAQRKWLGGVFVGQITAILGSLGGSATEGLGKENLPMTQTAFQYVLLLAVNGALMLIYRKKFVNKWYSYLGIAGMDVLATYSTIAALSYTTITSWSLLTPAGVLVCVPLSHYILKARYTFFHYIGIAVALVGMGMLLLSDNGDEGAGSNPLLGDFLILLGSALYSANSIWMEKVLKANAPSRELLCMMGAFGILYASIGVFLLGEHESSWASTNETGLLRFSAVFATFCFYCLYPIVLAWSGATVMQLSMLGMSIWSVPLRMMFFGGFGEHWWAFAIATVLSVGGMALYAWAGDVYGHAVNYEVLDEMGSEEDPMREESSSNIRVELQMAAGIHRQK
ncbi:hypothetical protein BSKO_11477 [Bryopsis sp. KO-2023]|nr:hypothetical protein BSKO_11477 [Bryopsis sp. KO-2023]